jgi:glycerol-3-phosphate O-acyltransferase
MRFASAIVSAALVLGVSTTTNAFTFSSHRLSNAHVVRTSSLASTTEDKTVDNTIEATTETTATTIATNAAANGLNDTARPSLTPEFQKARDSAFKALTSSLPNPALEKPLVHFMDEYFAALATAAKAGATNPDGTPITPTQAMQSMLTTLNFGMKYGLGVGPKGKFYFEDVRHKALRGDKNDERYESEEMKAMLGEDVNVDFYAEGCNFFRPSMDLKNSVVLGKENLMKAKAQLDAGENVIFLANHQSEADPQVVSCLFESVSKEIGNMAAHVTYVAGHKVTTDPLAVPFSMGRNLLCIHSKKHIDSDPETKPAKSKQNMAAMNSMLAGLKDGGMAIWVAPSGGRDRRDVATGKIPIAPFDQKTVDMFRLMGNKSKVPTHFYPMSMVSYDLCPPPDVIEAGVGEQRNVRFTPIGIAVRDEVPNLGGAEKRHLFTEHAEKEATDGYVQLLQELKMESYIP